MLNTFFSAKLTDYQTIKVALFSSVKKEENVPILLYDSDGLIEELNISNQSFLNGLVLYECKSKCELKLGIDYSICIPSFGVVPLDVNDAVFFKDFDELYYYEGNDLGANYTKEKTTFKIWAPLASKVVLMYKKNHDDFFKTFKMNREEKGVYSLTVEGDLDGYLYRYMVTNSGTTNIVTDPYGISSDANSKSSVVIDLNKTKIDLFNDVPPVYKNNINTIIYEFHVRDFTIDNSTDIEHRGKFLALTEEGRKTKGGNPAGLDYLKSLNITHVQLLPVLDYETVDELNTDKSYNWGYDPRQYFTLEGSFSTNPNDGYSRIVEFKKAVSSLHKNGIRVNLDVVYNHVYRYETSVFEKVVPNYYFRRFANGKMCNGSYCGNDFASERKMVRKLIIDSLVFLVKEYGIDGFRFDLMGLIDIKTINLALEECRKLNPNIMFYGEGWDMNTNLKQEEKATQYNSFKLENVGFFNDVYRDIARGKQYNLEVGYLLGNNDYKLGFCYAFLGSSYDYCYNKRYLSANQSVNYVECHDNVTLFDFIKIKFGNEYSNKKALKLINFINGTLALSLGIPFYHAGQEIGLSKQLEDNTYNMGDKYNKFSWSLLDERIDNYHYFKSILSFRKNNQEIYDFISKNAQNSVIFKDFGYGVQGIEIHNEADYLFIFNASNDSVTIEFDDYYELIAGSIGEIIGEEKIISKNVKLGGQTVYVYKKV
ncbi:MAG: type I pullulanase [Bacilli bacterium]|nr:type I pullulanase [Bacilli bacterium]